MSFSIRLKSCLLSETISCADCDRATLTLLAGTSHAEHSSGIALQGISSKAFIFFASPSQTSSVLSIEGLKYRSWAQEPHTRAKGLVTSCSPARPLYSGQPLCRQLLSHGSLAVSPGLLRTPASSARENGYHHVSQRKGQRDPVKTLPNQESVGLHVHQPKLTTVSNPTSH